MFGFIRKLAVPLAAACFLGLGLVHSAKADSIKLSYAGQSVSGSIYSYYFQVTEDSNGALTNSNTTAAGDQAQYGAGSDWSYAGGQTSSLTVGLFVTSSSYTAIPNYSTASFTADGTFAALGGNFSVATNSPIAGETTLTYTNTTKNYAITEGMLTQIVPGSTGLLGLLTIKTTTALAVGTKIEGQGFDELYVPNNGANTFTDSSNFSNQTITAAPLPQTASCGFGLLTLLAGGALARRFGRTTETV